MESEGVMLTAEEFELTQGYLAVWAHYWEVFQFFRDRYEAGEARKFTRDYLLKFNLVDELGKFDQAWDSFTIAHE